MIFYVLDSCTLYVVWRFYYQSDNYGSIVTCAEGGGYVIDSVCLSVCPSVCEQKHAKITQQIPRSFVLDYAILL